MERVEGTIMQYDNVTQLAEVLERGNGHTIGEIFPGGMKMDVVVEMGSGGRYRLAELNMTGRDANGDIVHIDIENDGDGTVTLMSKKNMRSGEEYFSNEEIYKFMTRDVRERLGA